jgi:crotonobetainyl-CoA:carnitine CoA-transferase CaiB-like acyl-CoA transferase
MTRPSASIRIVDAAHVLAGPLAACQLGVLGYGPHEVAEFRAAQIV